MRVVLKSSTLFLFNSYKLYISLKMLFKNINNIDNIFNFFRLKFESFKAVTNSTAFRLMYYIEEHMCYLYCGKQKNLLHTHIFIKLYALYEG